MKLKDLLLTLSPNTYFIVYDSAGMPCACGRAEEYQRYICDTKRVNARRKLYPVYYGKVVEAFPYYDDFACIPRLNIQIDYEP